MHNCHLTSLESNYAYTSLYLEMKLWNLLGNNWIDLEISDIGRRKVLIFPTRADPRVKKSHPTSLDINFSFKSNKLALKFLRDVKTEVLWYVCGSFIILLTFCTFLKTVILYALHFHLLYFWDATVKEIPMLIGPMGPSF